MSKTRKSLNFPLLITLFVTTTVVGTGMYILHGRQVKKHAGVYLEQAERAQSEGDYEAELDFRRRYAMLIPEDAEEYGKYAILLVQENRSAQTYFTLEEAMRKSPENADIRRELAELAIDLRRWQEALRHLGRLADGDTDSELLTLRAVCQEQLGNLKKGVDQLRVEGAYELYARSIKQDSSKIENYIHLADLSLKIFQNVLPEVKDDEESPEQDVLADDWLNQMVENNSSSFDAYYQRAAWKLEHAKEYFRSQKIDSIQDVQVGRNIRQTFFEEVLMDVEKSISLAPNDIQANLLNARANKRLTQMVPEEKESRLNNVRNRLAELQKDFPKEVALYLELVDVSLELEDPDGAEFWFHRGLDELSDAHELKWNHAQFLIDRAAQLAENAQRADFISSAETTLAELKSTDFPVARTDFLAGRIHVLRGEWLQAVQQFDVVRGLLSDSTILQKQSDLWSGYCYEQLGNADQQLLAYRRALEIDPNWPPARMGLAAALMKTGRFAEAAENYKYVVRQMGPEHPSNVMLIRLSITNETRKPKELQDWKRLEAAVERFIEDAPDNVNGPLLQSAIASAQSENLFAAEPVLRAAIAENSKTDRGWEVTLWPTLVEIILNAEWRDEGQQDWSRSSRVIEEMAQALGDCVEVRLSKGEFYAYQNARNKKEEYLKKLEALWNTAQFSESDQLRLATGLANTALNMQAYQLTEQLCEFVATREVNNLGIRMLLFDLAYRSKNDALARKWLGELEAIEGEGPLWNYGHALRQTMLAEQDAEKRNAHYDAALEHLQRTQTKRERWSRVPALRGHIQFAQSNFNEALSEYENALALGDREWRVISRAVVMLENQGRENAALSILQEVRQETAEFPADLFQVASSLLLKEDTGWALELAREASSQSNDWRDQLFFSRIFYILRQPNEALEKILSAKEMAPNEPDVHVALVLHYFKILQDEETAQLKLQEIESDADLTPENRAIALATARELIGQEEAARNEYTQAINRFNDNIGVLKRGAEYHLRNNEDNLAEPILNKLCDMETATLDQAEMEYIYWARQNLAFLLSARKEIESLVKADRLIDLNIANRDSPEDLRVKALIKAAYPSRQDKREAKKLLEQLTRKYITNARETDQFLLAQLHLADNEFDQYSALMSNLISPNSGNRSLYLQHYIDSLLAQANYADAGTYLTSLYQISQQNPSEELQRSLIDYQARILLGQGVSEQQLDQALNLVEEYVQEVSDQDETKQFETYEWAVNRLESYYHRYDQSEVDYREKIRTAADKFWNGILDSHLDEAINYASYLARTDRPQKSIEVLRANFRNASPAEIGNIIAAMLAFGQIDDETSAEVAVFLDQAIQFHQPVVPLVIAHADVLNWRGEYQQAAQLYRKILMQDRNQIVALNNLALIIAFQTPEKKEDALRYINRAIDHRGPDPGLIDSRGLVYLVTGDAESALADFTRVQIDSNSATSAFHVAVAHYRLGNQEQALKYYQLAQKQKLSLRKLHPQEHGLLRELEENLL